MEVTLYHPALKQTIRVTESAAKHHRKAGWRDAGTTATSGAGGRKPPVKRTATASEESEPTSSWARKREEG